MPKNNGKQNPEESSALHGLNPNLKKKNKYQKFIACSYLYKLACVDNKFSKLFKTYLGENAVYNFINTRIKESKYWSEVTEKHFNKELVITNEDHENFKNSTKC